MIGTGTPVSRQIANAMSIPIWLTLVALLFLRRRILVTCDFETPMARASFARAPFSDVLAITCFLHSSVIVIRSLRFFRRSTSPV